MAFEAEKRVVMIHAAAIIGDADQALAARFGFDADGVRASVKSILEKFLDDRGRAFDYFACGDFIGDILRQDANLGHALAHLLNLCFCTFRLNHDPQFIQLRLVDFAGRFGHEIDGSGGFRKGDDLANRFFAGQNHSDAIEA